MHQVTFYFNFFHGISISKLQISKDNSVKRFTFQCKRKHTNKFLCNGCEKITLKIHDMIKTELRRRNVFLDKDIVQ